MEQAQLSFLSELVPVPVVGKPLTREQKEAFLARVTKQQEWTPPTRQDVKRLKDELQRKMEK